jgi:hypothetical protein
MSMTRKEISNRFSSIVEKADKRNAKPGKKRFYPMTETRKGHLTTIGMYDGVTKRYVLCDMLSWRIEDSITEMEEMIGL